VLLLLISLWLSFAKTPAGFKISKIQQGRVTCPIKGNVKKKLLPFGSMPIFFSRHSAHLFERRLLLPRVVFLSPKVLLRFRVRSGETLLPRGSIFATVTAPFVS
jgi:hypothetical protein